MVCWGVPTSRRGRRPLLSTKQGEQSSSCGRQGSQGTCQGAGPAASFRACSALAVGDAAAEGQLLLLRFQPLLFLPSPPHPHHVPCPLRFSLRLLLSPAAPTPPFFFFFFIPGKPRNSHFEEESELLSPAGLQPLTKCSCSAVLTQANSVGTRCVFQSLLPLTSLLTTGIDCLHFAPSN